MRRAGSGSIPLVLGVTGHIDVLPAAVAKLEAESRRILQSIRRRYPHTPLILLSPLAEGADRLCARVALELGCRLIVPLPFARKEYEKTFEDDASRAEFASLLDRADDWYEIPPRTDGAKGHDAAYAALGAFMARQTQILFAYWDGHISRHHASSKDGGRPPPRKEGGTAQVVDYQLDGIPAKYDIEERNILDVPDYGVVYHVVTPRESGVADHEELHPLYAAEHQFGEDEAHTLSYATGDCIVLSVGPKGERCKQIFAPGSRSLPGKEAFERIDQYNRDVLQLKGSAGEDAKLRESFESLLPDQSAGMPAAVRVLANAFAASDVLALSLQGSVHRALRGFIVLGLLAIVCAQSFGTFSPRWDGFILMYLLVLSSAWIAHRIVRRQRREERYLDYRAFSESLRVQVFWRLGGLSQQVQHTYLRKQQGELAWIRYAVQNLNLLACRCGVAKGGQIAGKESAPRLDLVRKLWLESQDSYFNGNSSREGAAARNHRKHARLLNWGRAFYVVALLLAVGILLWDFEKLDFVALALALGPGFFGLLTLYAEKRAYDDEAKAYDRAGSLYRVALKRWAEVEADPDADPEDIENLLVSLGKEALQENGDWLILHRERPAEVLPV